MQKKINLLLDGYFDDVNGNKAINFFYVVFTGLSIDTSGGYRIFGKNLTGESFKLITKVAGVQNVGRLANNEYAAR